MILPLGPSRRPPLHPTGTSLCGVTMDGMRQNSIFGMNDVQGFSYCSRAMRTQIPKHEMPHDSMPKEVASQLIKDEMILDGQPRQNLASFVATYMEPEAEELMAMAATKNYIDIDEYPNVFSMQQRCVNMIARLFHAPLEETEEGTGTGTIGSSEAIMLATLAMKWRWKERRIAAGLPYDKPNIIFGANVQVCWHKATKYFEIESREAPVSPDSLVLTADRARPLIDENTIGVCPILGSTFNGEYEDIKGIHDMVVEVNAANGWDIPVHVDAASGGFVAPFVQPDLAWDFQLPQVKSINVSGHKYGLVYAGIGWIVFREKKDLPEDLVFHVNYLGGDQSSFTLNFSKSSANIVGQYYNFLRLGKQGYFQVRILCSGWQCVSLLLLKRRNGIALRSVLSLDIVDKEHTPVVAWALKDTAKYTVFDIQDKLRNKGWIVPAYTCPDGAEELAIMRVVVKENFSRDLAEMLLDDFVSRFGFKSIWFCLGTGFASVLTEFSDLLPRRLAGRPTRDADDRSGYWFSGIFVFFSCTLIAEFRFSITFSRFWTTPHGCQGSNKSERCTSFRCRPFATSLDPLRVHLSNHCVDGNPTARGDRVL
ncbi:unnamed protein product [Phaeothamnion confervicola]